MNAAVKIVLFQETGTDRERETVRERKTGLLPNIAIIEGIIILD